MNHTTHLLTSLLLTASVVACGGAERARSGPDGASGDPAVGGEVSGGGGASSGGGSSSGGSNGFGPGPAVQCGLPMGFGDAIADASAGAEGALERVAVSFYDGGALRELEGLACGLTDEDLGEIVPGDCVEAYDCGGCPVGLFFADEEGRRAHRLYGVPPHLGGCPEFAANYLIHMGEAPRPPSTGGGVSCRCDHCNGITNVTGYLRCVERCENAC